MSIKRLKLGWGLYLVLVVGVINFIVVPWAFATPITNADAKALATGLLGLAMGWIVRGGWTWGENE